jgi:hypothetical protein
MEGSCEAGGCECVNPALRGKLPLRCARLGVALANGMRKARRNAKRFQVCFVIDFLFSVDVDALNKSVTEMRFEPR